MQRDAGITLSELRVDGGAAANNLLMQFQATLESRPRPQSGYHGIAIGLASPSATGR
jgi:glycerol kinase